MQLVSVAALAENRVIGRDGEIPWRSIPEDRAQYRERVANAPVILGRRTFESMRDDLPGATQVVVSRSITSVDVPTAIVVSSVDEAIDAAARLLDGLERPTASERVAYVLGGGGIYDLFQPHLDRMVLSHVPGEYPGDTTYPAWDPDEWTVVSETAFDRFTLREWVRRDAETEVDSEG